MTAAIFIVFFLFGLIIGSFLNALVWRMHSGESLMTRSMCPECRGLIHWYYNIPVLSFAWLCGKCRRCHAAISWRYPLVELTTAVGFGSIALLWIEGGGLGQSLLTGEFFWWGLVFWLLTFSILVAIFAYDLLYFEIPMILIWIGLGATVLYLGMLDWPLIHSMSSGPGMGVGGFLSQSFLVWGVVAGGGAFLIFTGLSLGSGERLMGWGDAWLVLLLGAILGWPGVLWMITLGSGVGSILGLALFARGRGTMQTALPFAPFLIVGCVGVIIVDQLYRFGLVAIF